MDNSQLGVELEQKQLLATIANIERNLAFPACREVSNALLTYLNSLKNKLAAVEEKQKELEAEKQRSESMQRVAVLVERETALSSAEKEQYRGFLEKECFTKADFGSLEQFYTHTYDRLTEGGKAQMSHRVWEGVRRDEYQFSELPETVKEKEAQRLRDSFRADRHMHEELTAIPEKDRSDFVTAWDEGRKRDSYKVLDRPVFAQSVAVSVPVEAHAEVATAGAAKAVVENEKKAEKAETKGAPDRMGNAEIKPDDLSGISLGDSEVKAPLANHKKPSGGLTKGS